MTIREFLNMPQKCAVLCETREIAEQVFSAFDDAGFTWCTGNSYKDSQPWNGEGTCYTNKGTLGTVGFYEREDIPVYMPSDFEDFGGLKQEEPSWEDVFC